MNAAECDMEIAIRCQLPPRERARSRVPSRRALTVDKKKQTLILDSAVRRNDGSAKSERNERNERNEHSNPER